MKIFFQLFSVFIIALVEFYLLLCIKNKKLYYIGKKDNKFGLCSFTAFEKCNSELVLKIVSVILILIFAIRYLCGNEAIINTEKLQNTQITNKILLCIDLFLFWFNICINLTIALYPFFKIRTQENIIRIFGLPVTILTFLFLPGYSKGIIGIDTYNVFDIRIIFLTVELGISLGYSLFVFFTNFRKLSGEEIKKILIALPVMLLATMPPCTLMALFGPARTVIRIKDLSYMHRYVIYFSLILPILLYAGLKGKPKNVIYHTLLYISVATLISFSVEARFARFANLTNWPWHLCNTAMYIIPFCLIFKDKGKTKFANKLFYFTYFINVLGAFLAMLFPNYNSELNIFTSRVVVFFINHYIAFFMPLLLVELEIFERPKLKHFKYSMIAFFGYFVLMLILNAWFTNYNANVDFFFLNSDFIAKKLGKWALSTRNIRWEFHISSLTFIFYPLYQFLFFLTYVLLGLGMWFIYENMYKMVDHFADMKVRKQKLRLDKYALQQQLGGKTMQEPVYEAGKDKLVIKDFSKKYGKSNIYAVDKLNLEVNSGEIFGFLGPNGAGKSSTIKCLVGIQELTEGKIYVNGYDIETQSVEAKRQIGFVPDNYALYEKLTGREYLNFIADIFGVKQADRKETIEKYTNLLELGERIDNPIQTYSHGTKQKIAIIQALCHNPKLWILDEPLTGLDIGSINVVKQLMIDHAKNGNIVFFSSHIIEIVEELSDKVGVIRHGKLIDVKSMKEIKQNGKTLSDFYEECTKISGDEINETTENIKENNLLPRTD